MFLVKPPMSTLPVVDSPIFKLLPPEPKQISSLSKITSPAEPVPIPIEAPAVKELRLKEPVYERVTQGVSKSSLFKLMSPVFKNILLVSRLSTLPLVIKLPDPVILKSRWF